MNKHLNKYLTFFPALVGALFLSFTALPHTASAWTSAHLFNVDVTVEVSPDDLSRVTTMARFVVEGGRFHGFDLVNLRGAELLKDECFAATDDGQTFRLSLRRLRDGRVRVLLADENEIKRGGVTFTLVHATDFMAQGALRLYEGRARLDWTPLIWDEGLDSMTVRVVLPGESLDAPVTVDRAVSRDYVVQMATDSVALTKFRPVRWYPMQIVVDFDPALVPGLILDPPLNEKGKTPHAAIYNQAAAVSPRVPLHILALPAAVAFICLLALVLKALHVLRVFEQLGLRTQFAFLPRTSLPLRFSLGFVATALGLAAQHAGSVAAGVPALAAAASLFVMRREYALPRHRPGGTWRPMNEEDISMFRHLLAVYRRSRRTIFDITTPGGVISFCLLLGGLAYVVFTARGSAPRIGWTAVVDGLILAVPAWFGSVHAELPIDTTMEGFSVLLRWRRSFAKLIGAGTDAPDAAFWVREDGQGPIEVRLRAEPSLKGLNGIEIAGEVLRCGSLLRTRTAVVLRLEPGSDAGRRLAACRHAAEHHLTPDLEEEIVVLRNRRGRSSSGTAPLKAALSALAS